MMQAMEHTYNHTFAACATTAGALCAFFALQPRSRNMRRILAVVAASIIH